MPTEAVAWVSLKSCDPHLPILEDVSISTHETSTGLPAAQCWSWQAAVPSNSLGSVWSSFLSWYHYLEPTASWPERCLMHEMQRSFQLTTPYKLCVAILFHAQPPKISKQFKDRNWGPMLWPLLSMCKLIRKLSHWNKQSCLYQSALCAAVQLKRKLFALWLFCKATAQPYLLVLD